MARLLFCLVLVAGCGSAESKDESQPAAHVAAPVLQAPFVSTSPAQQFEPQREQLSAERMAELARDPIPRDFLTDEQNAIKRLEQEMLVPTAVIRIETEELLKDPNRSQDALFDGLAELRKHVDAINKLIRAYNQKHGEALEEYSVIKIVDAINKSVKGE